MKKEKVRGGGGKRDEKHQHVGVLINGEEPTPVNVTPGTMLLKRACVEGEDRT